jgi:tetratricopeptide (TPR) repeat protein
MRADVERYRRHEPVLARRGNWSYVAGRTLRRHRGWAIGFGVALLAVAAGTTAVAWQARVAHEEAARATAVKNFLLQVFKASDPRVASDKPRGQATARELLDAGTARIEHDFSTQPALQIELLGVVTDIYQQLGETKRYLEVQSHRVELAHRFPGRFVGAEVEALLNLAGDDVEEHDRVRARARLAEADALLKGAGLDESPERAQWWLVTGQATDPELQADRRQAYQRALDLFARHGPQLAGRITALGELGAVEFDAGDSAAAIRAYETALAAYRTAEDPNDGEAQTLWGNLAVVYVDVGRYDDAEHAYQLAADMALRTFGQADSSYWTAGATHARLLHLNGKRDEAMRMFEALRPLVSFPPKGGYDAGFFNTYARCLAAQGDPALALPWAQAAEHFFVDKPVQASSLRVARLSLGDIDEQLGRFDDARRMLKASYDDYVAHELPDRHTRTAATERWARFLVGQGDLATARRLFDEVLAQDHDRHLAHTAMAQAGLARIALAEGKASEARSASTAAMRRWAEVRGFRDVRMGAYITRVHASALLATGDREGARAAAESALADSVRHDAPGAASITEARALIAQSQAGH